MSTCHNLMWKTLAITSSSCPVILGGYEVKNKYTMHKVFLFQYADGTWHMQVMGNNREKIDVSTEEEAKALVETLYRMGEL